MRYHIDGTDRKFNRKIVEKGKIDISNTHIHESSTPFDSHFNYKKILRF